MPLLHLRHDSVAVIGDIHGSRDLLAALLDRVGERPLVVTGDVCDRGPDTSGVIDLLLARDARGTRGNHEDWLLAWARGDGFDSFVLRETFGGDATLASYGVEGRTPREVESQRWRVPPEHRRWLEALATAIDLHVAGARYWVTHAGIPSHRTFDGLAAADVVPWLVQRHPADLRWRTTEPEAMPPLDRPVIMGHVPREQPYDDGSILAIDTGAATRPGGRLTALLLPERRFVTVGLPLDPLADATRRG